MYLTVKSKDLLKKIGISLDRYPHGDLRRRIMLFKHFNINIIFDVGANKGQYGKLMRQLGYKNMLVSFEPLKTAFNHLKINSKNDHNWKVFNYAMGDQNTKMHINVSKNSVSSSFLNMLKVHIDESPDSIYINRELVEVKTFDSVFNEIHTEKHISLLKIDTQGFEMRVLLGAQNSLPHLTGIQMEMSLSQTYENEQNYLTIIDYLDKYGFKLFSIETGYHNKKSGQLYQIDGIFFKRTLDQK